MENASSAKEEVRNRPINIRGRSSSLYSRQRSSEWRTRREKLLALTRETYLTEGIQLVKDLQKAIHDNTEDANKVIFLCYERAVKDIYSYPIAALVFDSLGQQFDSACDSETVCSTLQLKLQNDLLSLSNKFSCMEELEGTDVGVIFLLYLLFKLGNRRGGGGTFFQHQLIKLFNSFYLYALSVGDSLKKGLGDSVISSMCVLCQVAYLHGNIQQGEQVEKALGFLRYCFIHSNIKALGRIQIRYTLREFHSRGNKSEPNGEDQNERYILECKRMHYLLDNIETVLFPELTLTVNSSLQLKEKCSSSNDSKVFRMSRRENQSYNPGPLSNSKYVKDSNGNIERQSSFPPLNGNTDSKNSLPSFSNIFEGKTRNNSLEKRTYPPESVNENGRTSDCQTDGDKMLDKLKTTENEQQSFTENW